MGFLLRLSVPEGAHRRVLSASGMKLLKKRLLSLVLSLQTSRMTVRLGLET